MTIQNLKKKSINELGMLYKETKDSKVFTFLVETLRLYCMKVLHMKYNYIAYDVKQDVVERTMENIWLSIDTYNDSLSGFKTWVVTILLNNMKSHFIVKNRRRREIYLSAFKNNYMSQGKMYGLDRMEERLFVEHEAEDEEYKYINLELLLEDLEEPYQELLRQKYVERVPYKILSDIHDLNENTLKTRMRIGTAKLRKMYANDPDKYNRFNT